MGVSTTRHAAQASRARARRALEYHVTSLGLTLRGGAHQAEGAACASASASASAPASASAALGRRGLEPYHDVGV